MCYLIVPFDYDGEIDTVIFHVKITLFPTKSPNFIATDETGVIVYCNYLDELYDYELLEMNDIEREFLWKDCELDNHVKFKKYDCLYANYKEVDDTIEYDAKFISI